MTKDRCGVCGGNGTCIKRNFKAAGKVDIVWGIKDLDRSNVDRNDPMDTNLGLLPNPFLRNSSSAIGSPIYDEKFDLASPEAQLHILHVCQSASANLMLVKITGLEKSAAASCFIYHFKEYVELRVSGSFVRILSL